MTHYLLELALWMLVFFFAGCCIGCLLKKLFSADEPVVAAAGAATRPVREVQPIKLTNAPVVETPAVASRSRRNTKKTASARLKEEQKKPAAAQDKMGRPKGIAAARAGKPDKLQRISGVGPKNEKILHGLGFFHFDQIAGWTPDQVDWIDNHLKFGGRIRREDWSKQAQLLADGNEEEFSKLYGTGGMRNKQGQKLSGSRTRKS